MANHFRSALDKLTDEELNALVSPLLAVMKAGSEAEDPVLEFAGRYEAAVEVNGRTVTPQFANGTTVADQTIADDEVEGFRSGPDRRPEEWRRFAGHLTAGKIGSRPLAGQTFSTFIGVQTFSTIIGAQRPNNTGS